MDQLRQFPISDGHIGKTENTRTGWEYNKFKKKQICVFSQLDKMTKNVFPQYTRFFFSISNFYDGALAPVLTRHCFTIFVLKSVKHAICVAYSLKNIWKQFGFLYYKLKLGSFSLNSRTTLFTGSGEGKAPLFPSKVESVSKTWQPSLRAKCLNLIFSPIAIAISSTHNLT